MTDNKKKFAIGSRAAASQKAAHTQDEAKIYRRHGEAEAQSPEPQEARKTPEQTASGPRAYEPTREFDSVRDAAAFDEFSELAGYEDVPSIEDILREIENAPDLEPAPSHTSNGRSRAVSGRTRKPDFVGRFAKWFKKSAVNKLIVIGSSAAAVAIVAGAVILTGGNGAAVRPNVVDPVDDVPVTEYDFVDKDEYEGVLLGKTEDAGSEYVEQTLFIGDSNTARISLYGFLNLSNVIGVESMGIQGVTSHKCVYFEGYSEPVTIPEAVKLMQPQRIVICFGTNNLGSGSSDSFISEYKSALKAIKDAYSYADIIIAAIPPVGKNAAVSQQTADEYNVSLIELAKSEGYTFLNISEVLKDSDGYIKSDYVIEDGIHVSRTGFQMLGRYFRTHAHITDDLRPKPLADIPTRKPAPAVHNEDMLDTAKVVSEALKLFAAGGFKSPTEQTDLSKGKSAMFSVPYEQGGGDEVTIADNLYKSVLAQTGLTSGYVGITARSDDSSKTHTFTIRILPDSETCNHQWGEWVVTKEATCSPGERKHTCTICGKSETEATEAVAQHEWGEPVVTKPATCTAEGEQTRTCAKCKAVAPEKIAALGHKWTTGANTDAEGWVVVTQATCTKEGSKTRTCSVCKGTETGVIPLAAHTYDAGDVTKEPTCGAAGVMTYTCTVCGGGAKTEEIPATGHKYSETANTQPTCTTDGKKTFTCSECRDNYTEVIAATGHTYVDGVCSCGATESTETTNPTA